MCFRPGIPRAFFCLPAAPHGSPTPAGAGPGTLGPPASCGALAGSQALPRAPNYLCRPRHTSPKSTRISLYKRPEIADTLYMDKTFSITLAASMLVFALMACAGA